MKQDLGKLILAFIFALAMTIWIFSMMGCDTTKRAERRQEKILQTHANVAMVAIRKVAPCITTGTSTTFDSSKYLSAIDSVKAVNDFYKILIDNVEPSFIHDTTKLVENNCDGYKTNEGVFKNKIFVLQEQINKLNNYINKIPPVVANIRDSIEDLSKVIEVTNNLESSTKENIKLTDKIQRRGKTILWLIIFLTGLSIPYIIKIVKYFTVPKVLSIIK